MVSTFGPTGTLLDVDDDAIGPRSIGIKFAAHGVRCLQYFRISSVGRWAQGKVVERSGPRSGPVSHELHIPQNAR